MLTPTTFRALVLAVHAERQPNEVGSQRAVQAVLAEFQLDQEWEVPLRALCTGAQAKEVLRWAKGAKG